MSILDIQPKSKVRYVRKQLFWWYSIFFGVICFPGIQIVSMFRNVCFGLLVVWNCFLSLLVVFRSFDSWYTSLPLYGNDVYKRALSGCNSEKDTTENAIETTFSVCDVKYCYEILIKRMDLLFFCVLIERMCLFGYFDICIVHIWIFSYCTCKTGQGVFIWINHQPACA